MKSTGFGLTFEELDLVMAKRVKDLLNTFDYKFEGALQVVQSSEAIVWFFKELVPKLEKNIFEMKDEQQVSNPVDHSESKAE